jgi:uncharacterized protein
LWLRARSGTLASCAPVERRGSFPQQDGGITDEAGVIAASDEGRIESSLQDYYTRTKGEVAVVIIRTLRNASVEDYAEDLFGAWGIGNKDKDSGVLLLVAVDQRKMRIETGYGAGAELTDVEADDILESQVRPRLQASDYAGAVDAGQRAIRAALGDEQADAAPPPVAQPGGAGRQAPRRTGGGISLLFFLLPLIFLFMSSGRRRRRRRGYYGGGGFGFPIFIGGGGWGGGGYGGGGGFGGSSGGLGGGGFGGFGGGDSGRRRRQRRLVTRATPSPTGRCAGSPAPST